MLERPNVGRKGNGYEERLIVEVYDLTEVMRTLAATYSPTGEPAVPLALKCFTAGFGMGPGGATLLWPPEEEWFVVCEPLLLG